MTRSTHQAVEVAGESVWLLPERAVWWPARRWLFVADLHWGKDATFRAAGLPVPPGGLADDLRRLGDLLARFDPASVLILGDLVHARASLHPAVGAEVGAWRAAQPVAMDLIEGNHDRHAPRLPAVWAIERVGERLVAPPFVFRHEPIATDEGYLWAGHLHPVTVLRAGKESWRLPCFHLGPAVGILPAFGDFTGGVVPRLPGEAYPICDGFVERP